MSRFRIKPPEGELLPAEDRLQNALKAILDRMREERTVRDKMYPDHNVTGGEVNWQHGFLAGLDIAWSLVKTESLGRQAPDGNPGFPYTKN